MVYVSSNHLDWSPLRSGVDICCYPLVRIHESSCSKVIPRLTCFIHRLYSENWTNCNFIHRFPKSCVEAISFILVKDSLFQEVSALNSDLRCQIHQKC